MKLKRILFSMVVMFIFIATTINCVALGGISTLGYENATCKFQPNYHKSEYSEESTLHGLSIYRQRNSSSAKTQMATASSLNCYVITSVYSNNGTLTGAHYKTEVTRPSSKWNSSITAKATISSSVNIRCVAHYGSHPSFCEGKEHIYHYYDASHPNDPE